METKMIYTRIYINLAVLLPSPLLHGCIYSSHITEQLLGHMSNKTVRYYLTGSE